METKLRLVVLASEDKLLQSVVYILVMRLADRSESRGSELVEILHLG